MAKKKIGCTDNTTTLPGNKIFSPPSGQKVVGFTHWNGRLFVACDYGVWELYDDPEIPGFTRHMEIARGTSDLL